ncbi:MAG: NYN domain-containing protein [Gemmatimonadales bacterium]
MPRDTIVYVDGFNLYYGLVRNTAHKWLDLEALCARVLPAEHHRVTRIKYFTAMVAPRPDDPQKATRQQLYLRALRTIPIVEIIYGHFLVHRVRLPLVNPTPTGPRTVEVLRAEEKGSDVNIATHLLCDAFDRAFEAAVVVSNDSDLVLPISVVRNKFGLIVGVLNPHPGVPAVQLRRTATFVKPIRRGVASVAQFPRLLRDAKGRFERPPQWTGGMS